MTPTKTAAANEGAETKYPEHEKLRAVHDETLLLSEFYDWLTSEGYWLAKFHEHDEACYVKGQRSCGFSESSLLITGERPDAIFGRFFGIDPKKLSAEKDAMVEELRAAAAR